MLPRLAFVLTFVLILTAAILSVGADTESWAPPATPADTVAVADTALPAAAAEAKPVTVERLTLRQRRELGLTIPAVLAAYRELKKDGSIAPDASKSEIAVQVLDKLSGDNAKAYQDAALDLDSILAFIERLIELISKLFKI